MVWAPARLGLYLVIHLLGAVEHVDHDAQRSAQVLGGFCLACARRPCRSPAHGQVQRLGEGDITPATHRKAEKVGPSEAGLRFKAIRGSTQLLERKAQVPPVCSPLCCGRRFLKGTFLTVLILPSFISLVHFSLFSPPPQAKYS